MAANEYILIKENTSNLHDEKRVTAESGKVLGFDEDLNPVMVSPSGTGVQQITGLSLDLSSWSQGSVFYEYALYDSNITEETIVEVVPNNEDYLVIQAAMILPMVESGAGYVMIYAVNAPTATIGVTLNLMTKSE